MPQENAAKEPDPVPKTKHDLWHVWKGMVARCHRESHPGWRNFGARGIVVCKRWKDDFWAFVADVGPRPEGHVLHIKDRSLGVYAPGNCEWIPRSGERARAAAETGVPSQTVLSRILAGWKPEDAVSRPSRGLGGTDCVLKATGTVKGRELKAVPVAHGPLRSCWKKAWPMLRLCLKHGQSCRFDFFVGNKRIAKLEVRG